MKVYITTVALAVLSTFVHADPVLNPDNGHFYEVIFANEVIALDRISWTTARNAATTLTFQGAIGHLATATTKQEDDFIKLLPDFDTAFIPFLFGSQFGDVGPWLGGTFNGTNWEWVAGDGEFSDGAGNAINGLYEDWLSHEPNADGPQVSGSREPRLGYFNSRVAPNNNVVGWADYPEFGFRVPAFVVEFEPIPEPGTLFLAALGMVGLAVHRRRRRTRQ